MHNFGSPITRSIINGPTCETDGIVHKAGGGAALAESHPLA